MSLDKIINFIARANSIRAYPINDDPFTVLKKFELLKQDQITNGCHLLFMDTESSLGTIEVGRFSSDTVIKDSMTIRTDLISDVDLLLEFVQKHISRGYHFKGDAQREERWEYPMEAIREIIINMIVHRDYMQPGDSIVKIFDDSIEFFNPGKLTGLTIEQLKTGNYVSSVRNKQIAMIFKEAGLIEKYGSGIRRVIKGFEEYQLKSPVFEEFQHGFRVTIFKTPQKTPQKNPVRLKIIDLLLVEPELSQRAVAEKLGISFDSVKEHFTKLKKESRIKRIGSRKNGFWEVLDK